MRKILYVLIALLLPALAFGQERVIKEEGKTIFKPHAYLQLQGGAAHTLGEADFTDLISPAAALNLGYRFSPVFGARIGASGWQGKGGWVAPPQVYDFKFVQGNIDLVMDVNSLFAEYNPYRVFNPYIFAGGGYAYGFENDGANALDLGDYDLEYLWEDSKGFPLGRFGLGFNFRMSDAVSFNLEGVANVISDRFNSKKADHPDWQFNALAGLTINLGKSYTKTEPIYYDPIPVAEPTPAPPPAPAPLPPPPPAPVVVKEFPVLPSVHFVRGSYKLDTNKYASELSTIVSVLKEFDNESVVLTGFCDHTGTEQLNNRLSVQRAEALKAYLVEQGIDGARMSTNGEGKDPTISGEEAYTVKARRVDVTK